MYCWDGVGRAEISPVEFQINKHKSVLLTIITYTNICQQKFVDLRNIIVIPRPGKLDQGKNYQWRTTSAFPSHTDAGYGTQNRLIKKLQKVSNYHVVKIMSGSFRFLLVQLGQAPTSTLCSLKEIVSAKGPCIDSFLTSLQLPILERTSSPNHPQTEGLGLLSDHHHDHREKPPW
jgi:hypothetical protein